MNHLPRESAYRGRRVLVTGGAGFLGSNLVHRLAAFGADVTVVDNFHPSYGANENNLQGLLDRVKLVREDVRSRDVMIELARDAEVIFHIAAQCSHVDSMTDPWLDLEYNCKGTLSVLEAARLSGHRPALVYAGTRAIIGAPLQIPATERTLPNPVDVYGVNKHAAELYGSVYARVHGLPFVSLRITNCYGPRHQMKNGKYGILNWFISLALKKQPVKIFGKGEQLRDYLYVDDAVEAFLRAGELSCRLREGKERFPSAQLSGPAVPYAVLNVGSGKSMRFVDCARKIVEEAGSEIEFVPWPADRAAIETGDYVADGTAAEEILGWKPKVEFDEGLARTFEFYRRESSHYL